MEMTKTFEDGSTFGPKEFGIAIGIAAVAAVAITVPMLKVQNYLHNKRQVKFLTILREEQNASIEEKS
jgi:Tfp pilus assembly major pilin PilA